MSTEWTNQLKMKLNETLREIKKKGVKVTTRQTQDSLIVEVDMESLIKRMREEAKAILEEKMRVMPFRPTYRKREGVELAVFKATGVLTEEDRKRLMELQTQYPDIFQWTYNEKNHQLRVVIVLNKFYEKGLEQIITKVQQELALIPDLQYEVKVDRNLLITVHLTDSSNVSSV